MLRHIIVKTGWRFVKRQFNVYYLIGGWTLSEQNPPQFKVFLGQNLGGGVKMDVLIFAWGPV